MSSEVRVKESYFWTQVKAGLSAPDVHLSRIENTAGTGISDVSACRDGKERWLELKVFHGERLHFRNSQRIWIMLRSQCGGVVHVVARKGNDVYVFPGPATVLSEHKSYPDKSFSILFSDLPKPTFHCKKPVDWTSLKNHLFDEVDQ